MPRGRIKRIYSPTFRPPPPGSIAERVVLLSPPEGQPLVHLTKKQACLRSGKRTTAFQDAIKVGEIPDGLPTTPRGHLRIWPAFWFDAIDRLRLEDAQKIIAARRKRRA